MDKPNQSPVIYLIHMTSRDGVLLPDSPLCALRRTFLAQEKKLKGKIQNSENGIPVKIWYRFSSHSFDWLKKTGKQLLQETCDEDYGWSLTTYAENGLPMSRMRFSHTHQWLQSAYYDLSAENAGSKPAKPCLYLVPAPNGIDRLDFDPDTQLCRRTALVFFPVPDPALNALLNGQFGEPEFVAETSSGRFYLCTTDEAQQRSDFLAAQAGNGLECSFVADEPDELDHFVLIDNTKPILPDLPSSDNTDKADKTTLENTPSELTEPNALEYSANHELSLFSESQPENTAVDDVPPTDKPDASPLPAPPQKYSVAACGLTGIINAPGLKAPSSSSKTDSPEDSGSSVPTPAEDPVSCIEQTPDLTKQPADSENSVSSPPEKGCENNSLSNTGIDLQPEHSAGPLVMDTITAAKRIVVSAHESYLYFGDIIQGLREGRGRTQMANGHTAYEGDYKQDQRDGFGTYYYKSGKPCYIGNWKQNRRDGLGVAFSSKDGSLFVGNWKDNIPTGCGTAFDKNGCILYSGEWKDGKRHGRGTEYVNGQVVYSGEWRNDQRAESSCLFKADQTEECYENN